jgi:hypothetical protein
MLLRLPHVNHSQVWIENASERQPGETPIQHLNRDWRECNAAARRALSFMKCWRDPLIALYEECQKKKGAGL